MVIFERLREAPSLENMMIDDGRKFSVGGIWKNMSNVVLLIEQGFIELRACFKVMITGLHA